MRIGRDWGAHAQRERVSAMPIWRAEAAQLTRHLCSTNWKICPAGRHGLAPPTLSVPSIYERSIGVKLSMAGDTPRVVGSVPNRVRRQRTTQGAHARGTASPRQRCWALVFTGQIFLGGTLRAP